MRALKPRGYADRTPNGYPAAVTIMCAVATDGRDGRHARCAGVALYNTLIGCGDCSRRLRLQEIVDAIDAYELKEWLLGGAPGRNIQLVGCMDLRRLLKKPLAM